MANLISPVVFGVLSLVFIGYGVKEVTHAYRVRLLRDWADKAIPGTCGILVGAMFADMAVQML